MIIMIAMVMEKIGNDAKKDEKCYYKTKKYPEIKIISTLHRNISQKTCPPPRFLVGSPLWGAFSERSVSNMAVGLPLSSNGILTHQINLSIGPAPVGAPTSSVHRSACVGAGLTWRSLDRSLRGNFTAGGWVGARSPNKNILLLRDTEPLPNYT